ncbi:MAG TPA: aldo/keto reductase [Burkholderiales bacterium]|nr:aldo/keto reductase [Burkholderiales bacterium]
MKIGDLEINRLGFGAMRICGPQIWGPPKDRAQAHRVLRRALALGVNFIDTADSYGPHVDEELIAEALHPYPKGLVIATKGGLVRPSAPRWDENGRPEHLRKAIEGSLKRLKLERIDLYQLHAIDPKVPLEDSLGPLVDAQRAGKIRHIGISNFDVAQLERARKVATIVSVQNEYNLGNRESEPVLERCEKLGIAFLPWYPLGAGAALRSAPVRKISGKTKATPAQVAIAWLLAKSPVMVPIPGTGSIAHLEENMGAAGLALSKEDLAALA